MVRSREGRGDKEGRGGGLGRGREGGGGEEVEGGTWEVMRSREGVQEGQVVGGVE